MRPISIVTPAIAFTPQRATAARGGTVTFAFGSVAHNAYFSSAPGGGTPTDITGANSNVSVTRTFSTAGTFTYNCHIHPGMSGTIVVAAMDTAVMSPGSNGYSRSGGY